MKLKIIALIIISALVLGIASVGFAALESEGPAARLVEACQEMFNNRTMNQQREHCPGCDGTPCDDAAQIRERRQVMNQVRTEAETLRRTSRMNGNGFGGSRHGKL